MTIREALSIFNMNSLSEVADKSELKKRFRRLAKANHPDLGGDAEVAKKINIAYNMLLNTSRECANKRDVDSDLISVPLDKVYCIYKEEGFITPSGHKLVKSNLGQYTVIVDSNVEIECEGQVYKFRASELHNSRGVYQISCKLSASTSKVTVTLRYYGKSESIDIRNRVTQMLVSIDSSTKLRVNIERVVVDKEPM